MLGTMEIAILCIVGFGILFGPKLIPKFGRHLGEGIKEFKNVGREISLGLEENLADEPKKRKGWRKSK